MSIKCSTQQLLHVETIKARESSAIEAILSVAFLAMTPNNATCITTLEVQYMGVPDLFFGKTNLKSWKILYDSNNFDPSLNYKMVDFHGLTKCTQTICF